MRQSLSALVRAIACSDFAAWAEVTDWRYCQIDVATRPATPRNSVDSGPWYSWRNLASLLFLLLLESPPALVGFVWHAGNILSFAPRGRGH